MIKVSFLLIFIVVVLHLAFAEDTDGGGGHEPQQPKKNQKDLSGNQIPVNEQLQPAGKGRQIVPSVDEDKSLKTRKGENIQEKQQQQASADDNSSNKIQKPLGGTGDGATGLLADQPECAKEVALYCQDALKTSDVIVMQCLLNVRPDGSHLGDTCHHLLWTYKAMMTEDQRFHQAAEQFCQAEFNQFKDDCNVPKEKAEKHLLFCLIDHKENMTTDGQCRNFLTRVETIVFSDFHLIGPFVTACRNEIENLKCGKVQEENDRQHTQGSTIACLLQKLVQTGKGADELNPKCRHELLRLAELQADDFNLDRPLYYACRDDRDKFCGEVQAGEGRVLACLTQLATHPHMSSLCREKLLLRQQVVAQDYRVSHALMRACQKDINQWKCQPAGADDFPQFFLSYVLLCLENAMHSGKQVAGECQAQMFDHRQAIMSDYRINPEVLSERLLRSSSNQS